MTKSLIVRRLLRMCFDADLEAALKIDQSIQVEEDVMVGVLRQDVAVC